MTEEEKKDVKEVATTPPVQEEEKPAEVVSEDVKTPEAEGQVDQNVYEKVREAMKTEREAKKAEKARNAELETRIAELESQTPQEEKKYGSYEAKVDILTLMNKDAFFKENSDLIEEKMADNPKMDVQSALTAVKSEFFDRIQKESQPVGDKPLTQQKPTATTEPVTQVKAPTIKDVLAGKVDIDPMQRQAIETIYGKQRS